MDSLKRISKYGGGFLASVLLVGKIFGPLTLQLQKTKTEEAITNESIIRRFDQSLAEGELRFQEDWSSVSEMIKSYFNIEGLAERLRTCRQEEKKELWNDMKIMVFSRLMASVYLSYVIKIISKAEMILIAKNLSKNHFLKDDVIFEKCRTLMDEVKGFYTILVAEICPIMIEVCKNILEFINIDHKIDDVDSIKSVMMQLKRRADVSMSVPKLMSKYHSSQLQLSEPIIELLIYCQSHNFQQLLDYMICDGLDEISIYGIEFLLSNGKNNLILSWITFLSAIFNSENNSIDKILMKKWEGDNNLVFSHLAVLFIENINKIKNNAKDY